MERRSSSEIFKITGNDKITDQLYICDPLRDLLQFVQFKKLEKHPWKSVTFSKVAGEKPTTLLKVTLFHGCFSCFSNCTNGTKLRKTPYIKLLRKCCKAVFLQLILCISNLK